MYFGAGLVLGASLMVFGHPEHGFPGGTGVSRQEIDPGLLPLPHYQPQAGDPAWLPLLVQLHGHLGPWVVLGFRLGAAGRQALGAEGYFDLEVVATGPFDRPPAACFLDGLQLATGATWGKRNVCWQPGEEISVRVTHRITGKQVLVRPRKEVVEALWEKAKPPVLDSGLGGESRSGDTPSVVQPPAPGAKGSQPGDAGDSAGSSLAEQANAEGKNVSESERRPGVSAGDTPQSQNIPLESRASMGSFPDRSHVRPPEEIEALARHLALLPAEQLLIIENPRPQLESRVGP